MPFASRFIGRYIITGRIRCETGLHIGAGNDDIQIGGMENPVMRDPISDQPYIPGSSLKGKLRYWSEWSLGLITLEKGESPPYPCSELKVAQDEAQDRDRWKRAFALARLFGPGKPDNDVRAVAGPSRLTVRDAFLTDESVETLQANLGEGIYVEEKTENTIDRITSEANPRPMERVPRGASFDFTLLVDFYDQDEKALLKTLFAAMALVEDSSIGGGGSRGHGAISFQGLGLQWNSLDYYLKATDPQAIDLQGKETVREIIAGFAGIFGG